MATLTVDEMARIREIVFDNLLDNGAVPYITIHSIYDVIQAHVASSTVTPTSSSTAVTTPGPVVLTVGSTTGITVGVPVQLDLDDLRESVSPRAILSPTTLSVVCSKLHSGTYPVEVVSPLTIVRGMVADYAKIDLIGRSQWRRAGIKKVDEIEFFQPGKDSRSAIDELEHARDLMRGRLASACGLTWILSQYRQYNRGTNSSFEAY